MRRSLGQRQGPCRGARRRARRRIFRVDSDASQSAEQSADTRLITWRRVIVIAVKNLNVSLSDNHARTKLGSAGHVVIRPMAEAEIMRELPD